MVQATLRSLLPQWQTEITIPVNFYVFVTINIVLPCWISTWQGWQGPSWQVWSHLWMPQFRTFSQGRWQATVVPQRPWRLVWPQGHDLEVQEDMTHCIQSIHVKNQEESKTTVLTLYKF